MLPVFHARKNPMKVVTFSNPSFYKKCIYVYDHAAYITHWTHHPVHEKVLIFGLFFFGITYISNLPTVCVKSSTLVLGFDIWNINFKKISIWFNFKKEILAWIMVNLKTLLILPKTKNLNLLHHVTLKI